MAYTVPGAVPAGGSSVRSRKAGATRMRASACWRPTSKLARFPALTVEGHQRVDLRGRGRPPVGAPGQARHDPPRARRLLGGRGRPAHQDARAARRLADAGGVERPQDGQRLHGAGRGELRVVAMVGERVVHAGAALSVDERQTDRVWSRGNPLPEAPRVGDLQLLAVERDVETRAESAAAPASADRELVLRVQRERMRDQQTPACAERQALHVLVVYPLARRRVGDLRAAPPCGPRSPGG